MIYLKKRKTILVLSGIVKEVLNFKVRSTNLKYSILHNINYSSN